MTTVIDVQLLQKLHHLLRQKSDLSERLEKAPRAIKVAENNELSFSQKLQQLKDLIQQTKIKADEKQLQLTEREAHIEKLSAQRNTCDNNREYQLLTDQIAADEQANGVLQDEILDLLEKIDNLQDESSQAATDLEKIKSDTAKTRERMQDESSAIATDLEAVQNEIQLAEQKLPADIRREYLRMVAAIGEDALAKVEDNTCGHCFQIISQQTFSQLKMFRAEFCGNCGSLLYLPQAQSAPG